MKRWSVNSPTGAPLALRMLPDYERLARHGHQQEALNNIAGAVSCGFVTAANVAKCLSVPLAEVEARAALYRESYPGDLVKKQKASDVRSQMAEAIAREIRKAGGLGTLNPTAGASKIVDALEHLNKD